MSMLLKLISARQRLRCFPRPRQTTTHALEVNRCYRNVLMSFSAAGTAGSTRRPFSKSRVLPQPSSRALGASEAVIERIFQSYMREGVSNLAIGSAHWGAMAALKDSAWQPTDGEESRNDLLAIKVSDDRYGNCGGEPALLEALREKLQHENGVCMKRREVLITCGANQAFVQALLALCDVGDQVVLFRPFYFSHLVALQLCGLRPLLIDCDSNGQPSIDAFIRALDLQVGAPTSSVFAPNATASSSAQTTQLSLASPHASNSFPTSSALHFPSSPSASSSLASSSSTRTSRITACVLTNPSNPSGVVCDPAIVSRLRSACARRGIWLISDEAYEHFTYDGAAHVSAAAINATQAATCAAAMAAGPAAAAAAPLDRTPSAASTAGAPHFGAEINVNLDEEGDSDVVVSLHTFSKSYGMPGWRVGYISYPTRLDEVMLKIQDTLPTHARCHAIEAPSRQIPSSRRATAQDARTLLESLVSGQPRLSCSHAFSLHAHDGKHVVRRAWVTTLASWELGKASRHSQRMAASAMERLGTQWVRERVRELEPVRRIFWDALRPLHEAHLESQSKLSKSSVGESRDESGNDTSDEARRGSFLKFHTVQPRGAFYYMLPLPRGLDEEQAVKLLAEQHRLLVLPGSAFGASGALRLSYGGQSSVAAAKEVAERIREAAATLSRHARP